MGPITRFIAALAFGLALASPVAAQSNTWYVRPDGGSRYSTNQPTGQCDGKGDAAYTGKGTNQHCAYNDYRALWDDKSYGNSKSGWVIAGGDTVIIRGGPWRVGWDAATGQNAGGYNSYCYGGDGNNACTNPTIPAGTAAQHTRILGENYASCSTGNATNKSGLTQIFGGYGVWMALNLNGAQYVDVECLDITRHSQCIVHGSPALPSGCNTSGPIDDYDSTGISTNTGTHDVLLQDVWVHGHTDRGIKGPIGGAVTCTRCEIDYNGMSGWDFDDGNQTASLPGSSWTLNYTSISWNGCNQEYPIVNAIPATSCYSQSSGGYGDGVGTPPGMCLAIHVDHSSFNYNTQDGFDGGHLDTGTGCPLSITNSQAIGNGGQTFKWGPNENPVVFTNNFAMANARRMSLPMTGAPSSYNAHLSDFLRAGDNLSFNFRTGGKALLANNTIIGYQPTSYDIQCWDTDATTGARSCPGSMLTFQDNITFGYDNPATYNSGGQAGGVGGLLTDNGIGVTRARNIWSGMRPSSFTCPTGFTGELCVDPLFVNEPTGQGINFIETALDNYNIALTSGSPAKGTGAGTVSVVTPPPPPPPPPVVTPPPAPTPVAQMANAVKVCDEYGRISAASVSTFTAQFGKGTTWEPSFTFTASFLPFYVYYTTPPINAFDPAPGVAKELDVQQQATAFTVTCTPNGGSPIVVPVPALPPPPAPPVLPETCTTTFTIDQKGLVTYGATTCK